MRSTFFLPILAATAFAAPVENVEKRAACSSYTIINTRGTGEIQGESSGFRSINAKVTSQVPGGKIYNTVYAAGFDQNSMLGTADIVRKVKADLSTNPNQCFILEGYSQGAAATVNAMSQLTGASFDAVKGVFLIGNPMHKAGLACNTDPMGGSTTDNVNGLSVFLGSIPANWVSKTMDVCAFVSSTNQIHVRARLLTSIQGDGVCDTTHGMGINMQHLSYPLDSNTQSLGEKYITKALGA